MNYLAETVIVILPLLLRFTFALESVKRPGSEDYTDKTLSGITTFTGLGTTYRNRRDVLKNPCEKETSCEVNKRYKVPLCYCDKECYKFNDCCHDYVQTPAISLSKSDVIECTSDQFGNAKRKKSLYGSYMSSNCPAHYKDDAGISSGCRDGVLFPVSSSTNGVTYKNVFCATCHNVTDFQLWSLELLFNWRCDMPLMQTITQSSKTWIEYAMTQACTSLFIPPKDASIRYCVKRQADELDDNDTRSLCESHLSPVIDSRNKVYRNIYCKKNKYDEVSCFNPEENEDITEGKGFGSTSMVGMFNLRPQVKGKSCRQGETYSSILGVCVAEAYINAYMWKNEISFVSNEKVNLNIVERLFATFSLSLPTEYELLLPDNRYSEGYVYYGHQENIMNKCFIVDIEYGCAIKGRKSLTDLTEFTSLMEELELNYTEIHENKSISLSMSKRKVQNCNITTSTRAYFKLEHKIVSELRDALGKSIHNRPKTEVPRSVDAKVVVYLNGTIKLETTYRFNNSDIGTNTHRTIWSISTILTYVTFGISDVSLILTIAIYKYFNLFKSTGGTASQHVMITLLAAQLVFTIGDGADDIRYLCLVIGIISHYLWLSAFTWVSIFLVNVFYTMYKMRSNPAGSTQKKNHSVSIILSGYIIPAIIVIPCMVLDLFSVVNFGYADRICFPTAYPANVYAFMLPILFFLLVNMIAAISSSVIISRYNNSIQSNSCLKEVKSLIPVYIRLIVLCACPWILGIFSDVYDSNVLRYIFILLAGSQGTMVSFSFLIGKRIRLKFKTTQIEK